MHLISIALLSSAGLAPLHVGGPPPVTGWWTHWRIDPGVAVLALGVAAAYILWVGPLNRRRPGAAERPVRAGQVVAFLGGCLALLIGLGPPLDDWSHYFLLSAHMVQHLILTLVVAPLWLIGLPEWVFAPLTRRAITRRIGYALTRPLVAFALPSVVFAAWHVPALYDAALAREPVHILEHQFFLLTALLGWWPILGQVSAWPRPTPPLRCLYLFALTVPSGITGAVITLAEPGLYAAYDDAPRLWGLDLATDQEIAGLLMWIGVNAFYLLLITIIFFGWAAGEESKERRGGHRYGAAELAERTPGGV